MVVLHGVCLLPLRDASVFFALKRPSFEVQPHRTERVSIFSRALAGGARSKSGLSKIFESTMCKHRQDEADAAINSAAKHLKVTCTKTRQ